MKYISFTLILLWSIWVLITQGDLKPSENYLLWCLGAFSIMYTIINIIIFCVKIQSYPNTKRN